MYFSAKIGQAVNPTTPKEYEGKWFFEIFVTVSTGERAFTLGQFGPFDSKDIAQVELILAAGEKYDELINSVRDPKQSLKGKLPVRVELQDPDARGLW